MRHITLFSRYIKISVVLLASVLFVGCGNLFSEDDNDQSALASPSSSSSSGTTTTSTTSSTSSTSTSTRVPSISRVDLVDNSLNVIQILRQGDTLNLDTLPSAFNFVVVSSDSSQTGSVSITLSGCENLDRWENFAPYTVANEGSGFSGLNQGQCTLTLTPYAGSNKSGDVGDTLNISFLVEGSSAPVVPPAEDTTAPVITISGFTNGANIGINEGASFNAPSASAVDDVDGIVAVSVNSNVNTNSVGNYTVVYSSTDASGNTATSTLFVRVRAVDVVSEPTNVLFIGNSYSIGYGGVRTIPNMFQALAQAAGYNPSVTGHLNAGATLAQHVLIYNVQNSINAQQWSHVVIQGNSLETTHHEDGNLASFLSRGEQIYDMVIANNPATRVHLYETWSRNADSGMIQGVDNSQSFVSTTSMQAEVTSGYQQLADQINANNPNNPPVVVNPVGQAWQVAGCLLETNDPNYISCHQNDYAHPLETGLYLSAVTHFAKMYNQSPVGLFSSSEVQSLGLGISSAEATFLENAAWDTVSNQ